ncbi:MAG: general secretion pathway protein GspE [Betaproteobacteria bacterium HGW-Betaproteobacteria-14]|nr:MAG: general secretion pathway protein GspE [Betaproteobacteria bacterium HGW-Betaproteobacteria-14]
MNAPAQGTLLPALEEALATAREASLREGRALVEVLEAQTGLSPEDFVAALAGLFEFPVFSMADLQAAEPAFDRVPFAEAVARGAVALRGPEGDVRLVFSDPFDADLEAWAHERLGSGMAACLAHRKDIEAWLAQQEERLRAMDDILGETGKTTSDEAVVDLSLVSISGDQSAVVKLVNSTIYDALKTGASDIHLECEADGLVIKYRVDGVLVSVGQARGLETAEQVISRVKVLAELDIAERRIPQDGRFKVRIQGREVDFRVSVMPNIFGEDAVLRLLDRRAIAESAQALRLDHLGLDGEAMAAIRKLSAKPHGMLLVTGPTGSGKTTTLYAAITEINSGRDKIVTIEDPVEYRLPRVLQIPVNEKKGLTFARGLRSILRHDPDKIMVGEIRDGETAQIAVQAALTGHLVFTTVHANNVFDVLGRFMHMGVDPYSFSAALNGIVAQRLLRMNCEHCSVEAQPDRALLEGLELKEGDLSGWRLRAGRGCGHCRGTGYKGRKAVAEVLILDDAMREMIAAKAPLTQLKEAARRAGTRPLRQTALEIVARGETTLEEVGRVVF